MRLLVAENDPALATFLHDGLEYELYTVDLAEDGDDAKYWVEQRHYDLAILDLDIERGQRRTSPPVCPRQAEPASHPGSF